MAIVNQYFSSISSMRFIFKSGVTAHFVGGKYRTPIASEIAELDAEIELRNPYIYVKPNEKTIDTANDDPLIGFKRKVIDDYLAEQAKLTDAAVNSNRDFGSSDKNADIHAANSNDSSGNAKASNVKDSVATLTKGMPAVNVTSKGK